MDIEIDASGLEFLIGDVGVDTNYPIRVIRAARERLQVIRAIPNFFHLGRWKSLDYRGNIESGSVNLIDEWRMQLESKPNATCPKVAIIKIWRASDV